MKTLLASILLSLLACGGGGSKSSTTNKPVTGGSDQPSVDPTIPSWLPQSCIAYHKAVVQAVDCKAIDQGKRDEIQKAFGETSESWKAEQNADKAKVDEIAARCTTATESVRAEIGQKCV